MSRTDRARYLEYRAHVEGDLLAPALRSAVLIFFLLQTFVFIPADYVLYPEHFRFFVTARLMLNAALGMIYFGTTYRYPVASSAAVCAVGTLLFLTMVYATGGVASGYYVGLILLVIGMGVLAPLDARQSGAIAVGMFAGYAALPLYTKDPVALRTFGENIFFLGAACVEAWWACMHMDRMRFADYMQQRELEEARDELAELDRAKARFSANVHHELRTPLTLILAPLDALRSGELGDLPLAVQKTMATMHANGRRLHKMINNLLDLSKLESSQFEIVRRPMYLEPLLGELVTGAGALAERKSVELSMQGFAGLPEINADAEALDKVFVNLIGNALKFTNEGDRVSVRAERRGDEVEISVEDTGLGIPPNKLNVIFDRFAQVDNSATRRHEGTGIGLSLAQEMIGLHGGRIWAESEGEGHGTTIHVVLPIGEPDELVDEVVLRDAAGAALAVGRSIEAIEADLRIESFSGASALAEMERSVDRWTDEREAGALRSDESVPDDTPEILIAEDNPDMRDLLAMLVGKEFRVRVAKNGREALEALRQRAPDLVLSDVMMPEMSGIELCRAIKGDEESRRIPVVLVTSKAEREMKIEGLELGADDYVTKPFHPRELLARVRTLVRVSSLQRQLAGRNEELETTLCELKQAEVHLVQSERLAAVGELAAGIAHEVNNPVNFALNAVRAMETTVKELRGVADELCAMDPSDPAVLAERLRSLQARAPHASATELTDELVELSGIIGEGLKRTSALVGDLRDFAVPGRSGKLRVGLDLEKGVRSTAQLLSYGLDQSRARLEIEAEPGLPTITGDPAGINQVLLNLIKNAAESFGPPGGTIRVTLRRVDEGVEVSVRDDGPGVSPRHLPVLFEPFFTTKPEGEGAGLGLSISRQIVDAHGGRLTLETEVGEGTCFVIWLPLEPPDTASVKRDLPKPDPS
ncbi:MAG: response regulator [Deltaproteobacteria bacterium]|nr:response regulator [Deltaproteobacteria bacterium]